MQKIEVEHALAISILKAIGGSEAADALERFQRYVEPSSSEPTARTLTKLETLVAELRARTDLEQIVERILLCEEEPDSEPRVCALLIDDLDRCTAKFTWELLMTLQRWSNVSNLFFVIAVDRERLSKAVEKWPNSPDDPEFALEKYIQHSFTVPDLDETRLERYLQRLATVNEQQDLQQSFVQATPLFFYGLRERTPRSVKRCINEILPTIVRKYTEGKRGDDLLRVIKEAVLAYSWPHFYQQHFRPAARQYAPTATQSGDLLVFATLQKRCDEFVRGVDGRNNDVDRLQFMLKRDSRGLYVELSEIISASDQEELDLQLVRFLGTPPLWFEQTRMTSEQIGNKAEEVGLISKKQPRELEERFQQLYFDGEAAEKEGDSQTSLDRARDILELIRSNRQFFNNTHAPSVGNVAINAERFADYSLADELYRMALDLEPEHSNNLQNYADFIVKKQIDQRYDIAAQIIERLKTGKHAGWKPERTAELEVLLAAQTGGQAPTQELEKVLQGFYTNPSDTRRFVSTMSLLQDINQFARAREVARLYYDAVAAPYMKYVGIRALADVLASSNDSNDELSAMELYRCMLERQCYPESDISEIKQNYAVLLYKYDINDEAGRIWYDAYVRAPEKPNIRRSYSLYLLRGGRPDLAKLVNEGQPLPPDEPPFLQPRDKPMPDTSFTADPYLGFDDMPSGPLVADLQP
ncbi:MAG: hypothetical protein JNM70_06350 [Anaerolineae bacterium]|nr:hypothetical protein [Anaerolineae bacterium]